MGIDWDKIGKLAEQAKRAGEAAWDRRDDLMDAAGKLYEKREQVGANIAALASTAAGQVTATVEGALHDPTRVGVATAVGAVVGLPVGGPVGAAVGAAVGARVGAMLARDPAHSEPDESQPKEPPAGG